MSRRGPEALSGMQSLLRGALSEWAPAGTPAIRVSESLHIVEGVSEDGTVEEALLHAWVLGVGPALCQQPLKHVIPLDFFLQGPHLAPQTSTPTRQRQNPCAHTHDD